MSIVVRRLTILAVAIVVAACVALAAAQPVTVRVAVGAVGTELQLHRQALQTFMAEHPGIRVELFETPSGGDRLGLYLQLFEAQSSEIDVLQIDVIWPGILQEHLVDLYQHGAADVVGGHFPGTVTNNVLDGRLLAIPYQIGAGMLYYRTDLLEKYGFDGPPRTWDELESMARAIMEGERAAGNPDMWGLVFQGNAYEGLTTNALEWIYSSGGGQIIEADRTISVYNDHAIRAIARAGRWIGTISPTGVTGMIEATSNDVFQSGNAVFMRNWPFAYAAGQREGSVIRDRFAVTVLPSGAEGGINAAALGGQTFGVSRYSRNVEAAAQVALYLASYPVQKLRAVEGAFAGTLSALYEDPDVIAAVPFFANVRPIFASAVGRPSAVLGDQYAAVSRLFFTAVHDVMTGRRDADTALALLELEVESITGFPVGAP
jgi:trehalose/maltose transport system substrate-binding protein